MAESHFQRPQQLPQGVGSWYPGPHHQYQSQPLPLQQRQNVQWSSAPPPDQPMHYPQQQSYQQGEFFSQVQHYSMPPQPQLGPPQFTYLYGQQDQVWPANSNWSYQQWAYPGLTQEEDWAAKARAWAAAKAALDIAQPPQQISAEQAYQNYQQQELQRLEHVDGQQFPSHSLVQEATVAVVHDDDAKLNQNISSKHLEQPVQDLSSIVTSEHTPDNSERTSDHDQSQSMEPQDLSLNHGQDNSIAAPPSFGKQEPVRQLSPLHQLTISSFSQPQSRLLQQTLAPPYSQQQQFSYTEQSLPSPYEFHQHSQFEFQQHQSQDFQQQQLPQHRPPVTMEGPEAEFGMPSASISMQSWSHMGGSGMPFPTTMGAGVTGSSQFDHPHPPLHPHQLPAPQNPMFGRPPGPQQGLGFPPGGPFGIGATPALGSGPGPGPGQVPGGPAGPFFIPDGNGNFSFPERPKKAAVPSWLREELMKKKAAGLAVASTGTLLSEESSQMNGESATHAIDRPGISERIRSDSPGMSDVEDEDEDGESEIEAARNAAINQEIKRVLTEVLLKVTGDLFDEIAQEVLDEDDEDSSSGKILNAAETRTAKPRPISPPHASAPAAPARVLISSVKRHGTKSDSDNESLNSGAAAGNVLGLANYASDDDVTEMNAKQPPSKEMKRETELRNLGRMVVGERWDRNERKAEDGLGGIYRNERKAEDRLGGETKTKEQSGLKEKPMESGMHKEIEKYKNKDSSREKQSSGREEEKESEREKKRQKEGGKSVRSPASPEIGQGHGREHHVESGVTSEHKRTVHRSTKLEAETSSITLLEPMERQSKAISKGAKGKLIQVGDVVGGEVEKNTSGNKVPLGVADDKEHRKLEDKIGNQNGSKGESVLGKEEVIAAIAKVSMVSTDTKNIKKERGTREHAKAHRLFDASFSGNETEEKTKVSIKKKGADIEEDEKDLNERGRERRNEKSKEKAREHDKERGYDRRKNEKEKHERKSGGKRADVQDHRRSRHRSSSASSRGRSRSASAGSPDSGRRQPSRHMNKRRGSFSSSPERSKKRRVPRSRSRSPKHCHRRNSPSPSRERSRYIKSRSRSPAHRPRLN